VPSGATARTAPNQVPDGPSRTFDHAGTLGYAPPAPDGLSVTGHVRPVGREPDVKNETLGLGR
jgi:hypothetical protein